MFNHNDINRGQIMKLTVEDIPDFETRYIPVTESGCWLWIGPISREYGLYNRRGMRERAHRAAYILFKGPIPEGLCVCHRCDTPSCVNPAHLFLGTRKDNWDDMRSKNRHFYQDAEFMTVMRNKRKLSDEWKQRISASKKGKMTVNKLTREQVLDIIKSTESHEQLAIKLGVTSRAIYDIRVGKTWSDLTDIKRNK